MLIYKAWATWHENVLEWKRLARAAQKVITRWDNMDLVRNSVTHFVSCALSCARSIFCSAPRLCFSSFCFGLASSHGSLFSAALN